MENGGRTSLILAVLLGSSSAVTAVFYAIYRQKSKAVRMLKEAQILSLDQDLHRILQAAPGKCVPYAVIEGVVRSVKETLSSQFVDNCQGVIQRLSLKEHKLVWNRTTHLWNDCEKLFHQRTNTVPFELVPEDPSSGSVSIRVLKPMEAGELDLETVYEKFHPSVQSFTDSIGHYFSGERPKGILETEEMLKVGTTVTAVGEVVLDHETIKFQPPKTGMQYYLSSLNFQSLVQKQESRMRIWKILTLVFGVATCTSLFFILRRQYLLYRENQRRKEVQNLFQESQARLQRDGYPENEETVKNICIVCFSNSISCVFLECGHVCSCHTCYQALVEPKTCPLCRSPISRVVHLYNS